MNAETKVLVAPSLLSADFAHLADEVAAVEQAGADWLHFDVMDGRFVPNLTVGVPVLKALRKITSLVLDVHLMIVEPERYVEAFAEAGADVITVHVEACTHLERTLAQIRSLGKKAGVALNPHTPPEVLKYVAHQTDLVLAMTVNPGFGGQKFIEAVVPKIREIADLRSKTGAKFVIEVDGGMNADTAKRVLEAGAEVIVAGSYVFGSSNYADAIASLRP